MARKNNNDREPLSFWGTVGANMVGGLIMGGVTTLVSLVVFGGVVRRVESLEGAMQPPQLPPNGGG